MLLGLAFKARVLILHAENMQRTILNVFLWHQYTAGLSYSEAFLNKGTKRLLLIIWNILLKYQNCQKLKSANYNFIASHQSFKEGPIIVHVLAAKWWYQHLFMSNDLCVSFSVIWFLGTRKI